MEVIVLKKIVLSPVALVSVGGDGYIVNDPHYIGSTLHDLQRYVDSVVYDVHQTLQYTDKEYGVENILDVLFSRYSRVC